MSFDECPRFWLVEEYSEREVSSVQMLSADFMVAGEGVKLSQDLIIICYDMIMNLDII